MAVAGVAGQGEVRLARTVGAVETRRRVAYLTHAAYRWRHADKPPVGDSVQVGELDGSFACRRENLLPYEEDVVARVRMMAVETVRARQRRRLMDQRR